MGDYIVTEQVGFLAKPLLVEHRFKTKKQALDFMKCNSSSFRLTKIVKL